MEIDINNIFSDNEDGETKSILSVSITENVESGVEKPTVPFNNDNDFSNFQLGELVLHNQTLCFIITHK